MFKCMFHLILSASFLIKCDETMKYYNSRRCHDANVMFVVIFIEKIFVKQKGTYLAVYMDPCMMMRDV